jgi:hypothetical protein
VTAVSATAAAQPRSSRAGAAVAVATGTALAGAVALAVEASRHAAPSEVSPVVPRGSWNAAWVGGLIAAFALYPLGTVLARRGHLRLRVALVVAVAVQALPLAAPLLLSKDAYLYWGEGRVLAVHHANPYRATPGDYPSDASTRWVSESWRDQPAPYGPAWEVVGAGPALVGGASAHRAELAYRGLAALALLASVALVARRTRSPGAVAFLGWSPLLAVHYAGGGHGDAVMMVCLLGAVAAGATAAGGALWPVASAFKPVAAVLLPLELARRRLQMPRAWWAAVVATGIAVVLGSTALFGPHWVGALTTGAHQAAPLGGVHWLTELGLAHRYAVVTAGLVFVALYAMLLRGAWRGGRPRLSLGASALCITSSLLRPWYALWPVALAALEDDPVAMAAAFALTGYLLFGDAVLT